MIDITGEYSARGELKITIRNDMVIAEPQVFGDKRGYSMETYNPKAFHDIKKYE